MVSYNASRGCTPLRHYLLGDSYETVVPDCELELIKEKNISEENITLIEQEPILLEKPERIVYLLTDLEKFVLETLIKENKPLSIGQIHSRIQDGGIFYLYKIIMKKENFSEYNYKHLTYNEKKEQLKQYNITIPSFNRVKNILENFTEWGVTISRTGVGKASTYYLLSFSFRELFLEAVVKEINLNEDFTKQFVEGLNVVRE